MVVWWVRKKEEFFFLLWNKFLANKVIRPCLILPITIEILKFPNPIACAIVPCVNLLHLVNFLLLTGGARSRPAEAAFALHPQVFLLSQGWPDQSACSSPSGKVSCSFISFLLLQALQHVSNLEEEGLLSQEAASKLMVLLQEKIQI